MFFNRRPLRTALFIAPSFGRLRLDVLDVLDVLYVLGVLDVLDVLDVLYVLDVKKINILC